MQSLVDKCVCFEIKQVPTGRKVIPLRIVLKIQLASDGTIDKYKARCVVLAGFRQTAGLDYDPQGTYYYYVQTYDGANDAEARLIKCQ